VLPRRQSADFTECVAQSLCVYICVLVFVVCVRVRVCSAARQRGPHYFCLSGPDVVNNEPLNIIFYSVASNTLSAYVCVYIYNIRQCCNADSPMDAAGGGRRPHPLGVRHGPGQQRSLLASPVVGHSGDDGRLVPLPISPPPPVSMSLCLSVSMSLCLYVSMSLCLSVSPSLCSLTISCFCSLYPDGCCLPPLALVPPCLAWQSPSSHHH
jgi:hypothetical protein